MAVYKDNATRKWRVIYRFTDFTGKRKQTQKRGFATRKEAVAWEREMMLKLQAKLDMTFASFYEIYEADRKPRIKGSTWETKSHIVRTKILPYFGERKIDEIDTKDIIAWQNELLAYTDENGKKYSQDYLRTVHSQLTAIFNHAMNYYNLPYNPARLFGFKLDNNSYNLELHGLVLKKLGIHMYGSEGFEDYQSIYEETMKTAEKHNLEYERGYADMKWEIGRGR